MTLTFKSITGAHTLTIKHSVFSIMAGLLIEMLLRCSLFKTLFNGLKMSEYKLLANGFSINW